MNLETKLNQLEQTAEKLDSKELSLEEAVGLFEEGVKLIRECLDNLNAYKGKIEVIRGDLEEMLRNKGE